MKDIKVVNEIVEFNQFESNLVEFKSQYEGIVYDLTDDDQAVKANKDRLEIGRVISKLDKTHKELKAPLKIRTDLIDHERKRIKDGLLELQLGIKSQIQIHKAIALKRAEEITENIAAISITCDELPNESVEGLKALIADVQGVEITEESFGPRRGDAMLAKEEGLKRLADRLLEAVNEAKAKEEAEAKAAADLEAEIVAREKAAAEAAKAQAEEAAEEAISREKEAAEAAEAAKAAAEEAAKAAEEHVKEAAEFAAAKATAEAADMRKADDERLAARDLKIKKNKQKLTYIAKAIKEAGGIDTEQAKKITIAIRDGNIKNVYIGDVK